MDIKQIIDDLIDNNIFEAAPTEYFRLKGGTVSDLYFLKVAGMDYVVKSNLQQVIKEEAQFLNTYKNITLFPNLLYIEPTYKYILYSFIEGTTNYLEIAKENWLQTLVKEVLNHYHEAPEADGWGWADQPVDSWQNFQLNEIAFAKEVIGSRLDPEAHDCVYNLAKNNKLENKQYLLHGDCGVHNFIFNNGKLTGVIDPTPVIGHPLYDLIYAFCSSPNALTKETIKVATKHLIHSETLEDSILYEQVVIALYIRLEACLVHHSQEFEEYLDAWSYWINLVK